MPSEDELEELASNIHAQCNRLKIEEPKITAIDKENEELSEKAYKMPLYWNQEKGCGTTYNVLFKALKQIG